MHHLYEAIDVHVFRPASTSCSIYRVQDWSRVPLASLRREAITLKLPHLLYYRAIDARHGIAWERAGIERE